MNRRILIAAASVLVLTGCQSVPPSVFFIRSGGVIRIATKPDAKQPIVHVDDVRNRILVDQEPIYAKEDPDTEKETDKNKKRKKITWIVNPDQPYEFLEKGGIEICPATPSHKRCDPPKEPNCERDKQDYKKFECKYKLPDEDIIYFYTIRLIGLSGAKTPPALDPSIMN